MRPFMRYAKICLALPLLSVLVLPACKNKLAHSAASVEKAMPAPLPAPVTLLALDRSAFHAKVHLDGDLVYVLTDDAIFAVAPGQAPRGRKLAMGFTSAATPSAFIYWDQGFLMRVSKLGGDPAKLGPVPREPQFLLAMGELIAWVDKDDQGAFTVRVFDGSQGRVIHAAAGRIVAATGAGDRAVFVEQMKDGPYRLVSVPVTGGEATFGRPRKGRPPAMLTSFEGTVAYYDGNAFEVRSLSADLRQEQVVGNNLICSPIALADRIYCGQVEGLSVLLPADHSITLLSPNARTLVTALTADPRRVVYILDAAGKMEVRQLLRQ